MTTSDWRALDLSPHGRSLVEASAGTGKTWTIAALYLRLLLEPRDGPALGPRGIVVSTFTDAAAQELRQRIRARLQGAQLLLAHARQTPDEWLDRDLHGDDVLRWLRECCIASDGSFDAGKTDDFHLRLQLALAELDLAPIGTLHALCQRILREQPFASGMGFGHVELVAGTELDGELADDLWRQLAQSPGPLSPEQQAWFDTGRKQLTSAVGDALKPGVEVPCLPAPDIASLLQPGMSNALRERADDAGWFKSTKSVWIRGMRGLADWIDIGEPVVPNEKVLEDLGKAIESQIKPARLADAGADDVFVFAMRAVDLLSSAPAILRARGLAEFAPQLRANRDARLQARGQLSFDAVITRVHAALQASTALADALHAKWPVALVDEFQDTDRLQYEILDRIHRDAAGQVRGRLVMIGDPKQAIYRFRGGDIDAYLRAAGQVDAEDVMHLDTNHRSARGYVAACNELFDIAGNALSADARHTIAYREVEASARRDGTPYRVDDTAVGRPLVFHHLDVAPDKVEQRRDAALDACADQIVQLLSGSHAIGDVPLQPGDIAVLLPKNRHVSDLRTRLHARGVPCVGGGRSSVFATDWARELQVLLHAAAQPADPGLVRAALATRIGGIDYQGLLALADAGNAAQWQLCLDRFAELHARWEACGVLAVVQALIDGAASRLMAAQDGERGLTDLRHLGELLQAQEARQAGHAQLLAWLSAQRDGEGKGKGKGSDSEDAANGRELRIESDAKRVQLMTLHAAKGLEFPVVLLPLLWDSTWHRPTSHHGFAFVTDPATGIRQLRNDTAACEQAMHEDQEERFRLLYVALTRAEHACHVYVLRPDRPAKGNSKASLQDPERSPLDALLERANAALGEGRSLQDAGKHIAWRLGWPESKGIHRPEMPARNPVQVRLEPPPAPLVRRHSFSSMLRGSHGLQEEHAATDEAPTSVADVLDEVIEASQRMQDLEIAQPAHPTLAALAHWRGTEFGLALHDVLEQRLVGVPVRDQPELVRECLRKRGVRPWQESPELEQVLGIVAARLDATLDAELQPGLRLSDLPAHALRAEMAFDYLLGDATTERLLAACRDAGEAGLVPVLAMRSLQGLMNGKIDLVFEHEGRFHVLDWKGNWLGDQLEAYAPGALPAAMDIHHYRLQALLYTVALHRYLRTRLGKGYRPSEHLGDPVYLFLRAVGLAPGAGIWTQHFSPELINAVDATLAGKPEVSA